MLACGDTYRPTLQDKSTPLELSISDSGLFMAAAMLEKVTTLQCSVNMKNVLQHGLSFVFLSLASI